MHDLLDQLAPDVDVDAAWDEVSDRLEQPSRGRSVRVLAVTAAVVLVAGGAILASRSGDGDSDGLTPLGGGLVRYEVPEADVTVDLPEDWHRRVVEADGDFGPAVLLSTMPIEATTAGDALCDGLEALGPTDVLVSIGRRTGRGPGDAGEFLQPTGDLTLPEGDGSAEYGDCPGDLVPFAVDGYGIERGRRGLDAGVFIGPEASQHSRDEVSAVLASLLPPVLSYRNHAAGVTVGFPSGWQIADGQLVAPIRGDPSPQILALGTFAMEADELECAGSGCSARCPQLPNRALEAMGATDVLIWVDELLMANIANAPTRPEEFVTLPFATGEQLPPTCRHHGSQPGRLMFFDGNRIFTVSVALGADASDETKAEALAILNSLTFEPATN